MAALPVSDGKLLKRIDPHIGAEPQRESQQSDTLNSLRRYFNLLLAQVRREELSRRANPTESLLNLMEPVGIIAVMTFAMWLVGRQRNALVGGSLVLFFATGFFAKYYFIYVSQRMRRSIDGPRQRFPMETRLDQIIVHVVICTMDYAVLGLLLFGGIYIVFDSNSYPKDCLAIAKAYLAIGAIGFGVGVVNLVMTKKYRLWRFFFAPILRFSVLLSGAMFVVDFFLPSVRFLLSFNPIVHAIILFRQGFYNDYPHLILDENYMWTCATAAVFIGLVVERVTKRSEL